MRSRFQAIAVGVLVCVGIAGCVRAPREDPAPVATQVRIDPYVDSTEKTLLASVLPDGTSAGKAVPVADIEIVPVFEPAAPASTEYLTLDEAIEAGLCTVRETGIAQRDAQGNEVVVDGDVNTLLVTNRAEKPIFLMVGDLVLGGKQDRILATSLVVEPGAVDQRVSVFCVEAGRWSAHGSEAHSVQGRFVNSGKQGQVDLNVKRAALAGQSQQHVWDAVARNNSALGVSGGGTSFRQTYDSAEVQKKLDELMAQAAPLREAGAVGFAVQRNGEVLAMDLFDSPELCRKLSEKLLRSYLITALSGAYDTMQPGPLQLQLRDRVTAEFRNVPLSQVVAAIDREWRGTLRMEGTLDPALTLSCDNVELHEVLGNLYAREHIMASRLDDGAIALQVKVLQMEGAQASAPVTEGQSDTFDLRMNTRVQTASTLQSQDDGRTRSFGSFNLHFGPSYMAATSIESALKDDTRGRTVHRSFMKR